MYQHRFRLITRERNLNFHWLNYNVLPVFNHRWIIYVPGLRDNLRFVSGFTAGGHYSETGAAADYICLTDEPLWGWYDDADQRYTGNVYGAEYQFGEQTYADGGADMFDENLYEHDVPCALCHSNRNAIVMIPGRNQCYEGWNLEYSGYLVSGSPTHTAASNYACLDSRPETEFGDVENKNGKLMYTTEAVCGSLKCPPYVQYRELTCVVCSK